MENHIIHTMYILYKSFEITHTDKLNNETK